METFVVQLWARADGTEASRSDLRGFVEHVGSGRREPFREAQELLAFFEAHREPQPKEVRE